MRDGAIRHFISSNKGHKAVLVSRGEEISTLRPESLERLELLELEPVANFSDNDPV